MSSKNSDFRYKNFNDFCEKNCFTPEEAIKFLSKEIKKIESKKNEK